MKYIDDGRIISPVRAWERFDDAEKMSIHTGYRIILRLKFPKNAPKMNGFFGQERILLRDYDFSGF